MKHALLLNLSCLVLFVIFGTAAHADTFAFNASGNSFYPGAKVGIYFTSTGFLTAVTDPNLPNTFDITNISGTFNIGFPGEVETISLLPCPTFNDCSSSGADGFVYNNRFEYLNPAGGPVPNGDFIGSVGFAIGSSGLQGGFASSGTHNIPYLLLNIAHYDDAEPSDFTVMPVPEPDGFILFGTGLLGMVGTLRRRLS